MCDPHLRLRRLLAGLAGPLATLVDAACTPWRSATFAGERHRFRFTLPADALHPLDQLDEADLAMPGHMVAEIGCTTRPGMDGGTLVELAILTLEAG